MTLKVGLQECQVLKHMGHMHIQDPEFIAIRCYCGNVRKVAGIDCWISGYSPDGHSYVKNYFVSGNENILRI